MLPQKDHILVAYKVSVCEKKKLRGGFVGSREKRNTGTVSTWEDVGEKIKNRKTRVTKGTELIGV